MFLHLSVILSTGGGVCHSAWWDTPPWADTPLGRHPLGRNPLPGRHPPQANTPHPGQTPQHPGQTPPGRHPPGQTPPWADTLGYTWLLLQVVRILLECILVGDVFKHLVFPRLVLFFVDSMRKSMYHKC